MGTASAPVTVADALSSFAVAYSGTGYQLNRSDLTLVDEAGKPLGSDNAVLPCGLKPGADAFVRSKVAPVALSPEMAAAAAAKATAAKAAAARPVAVAAAKPAAAAVGSSSSSSSSSAAAVDVSGAEESRQKGVYAKPGSAIAASQAKMGENSYYYSVGRNKAVAPGKPHSGKPGGDGAGGDGGVVAAPADAVIPPPVKVAERPAKMPEQTITSYAFLDDDDVAKVHINLAGAGLLPEGAVVCDFRERSFDLRVTSGGKVLRLHIPILGEEIKEAECVVKKKPSKLIVCMPKRESKGWYELRKTKGVGDTEYSKITPDAGETCVFTI
jgi:hypothetical protein